MPTVAKVFTSADIFQGPAEVYLGVAPPPSAVPPVQYTNTVQLDNLGQPFVGTIGQITGVTVAAGGSGYVAGDTIQPTQGSATGALVRVLTVSSGAVATVAILRGGQGYSTASGLATSGGTGSGCTLTISSISAGVHFGITEAPAQVQIAPKYELIKGDNFSGEIDGALVSMASEIDIVIKEMALANLVQLFTGLFSATYWNLGAGSTNPAVDLLQIGNTNSSQALTAPLMLVAPRRDALSKFLYVLAYRTYIKSAVQFSVGRPKENLFKLKFSCLADMNRVVKDRVMQIIRTT